MEDRESKTDVCVETNILPEAMEQFHDLSKWTSETKEIAEGKKVQVKLLHMADSFEDIEMKKSQRKRRRVIVEEDSEEHLDYNENSMHDLVDDESSSELEGNTVWVQCENPECQKWRRITEQENLGELSEMKWICSMNKDPQRNSCEASQEPLPPEFSEDEYVYTSYQSGSLIWCKMSGYPWWPGMIEKDPDYHIFSFSETRGRNIHTQYHVTFFGKDVSRAWISEFNVRKMDETDTIQDMGTTKYRGINFARSLSEAFANAKECFTLSIKERLKTYGFLKRYKGKEYPGNPSSSQESNGCDETTKGKKPPKSKTKKSLSDTGKMKSNDKNKALKDEGRSQKKKIVKKSIVKKTSTLNEGAVGKIEKPEENTSKQVQPDPKSPAIKKTSKSEKKPRKKKIAVEKSVDNQDLETTKDGQETKEPEGSSLENILDVKVPVTKKAISKKEKKPRKKKTSVGKTAEGKDLQSKGDENDKENDKGTDCRISSKEKTSKVSGGAGVTSTSLSCAESVREADQLKNSSPVDVVVKKESPYKGERRTLPSEEKTVVEKDKNVKYKKEKKNTGSTVVKKDENDNKVDQGKPKMKRPRKKSKGTSTKNANTSKDENLSTAVQDNTTESIAKGESVAAKEDSKSKTVNRKRKRTDSNETEKKKSKAANKNSTKSEKAPSEKKRVKKEVKSDQISDINIKDENAVVPQDDEQKNFDSETNKRTSLLVDKNNNTECLSQDISTELLNNVTKLMSSSSPTQETVNAVVPDTNSKIDKQPVKEKASTKKPEDQKNARDKKGSAPKKPIFQKPVKKPVYKEHTLVSEEAVSTARSEVVPISAREEQTKLPDLVDPKIPSVSVEEALTSSANDIPMPKLKKRGFTVPKKAPTTIEEDNDNDFTDALETYFSTRKTMGGKIPRTDKVGEDFPLSYDRLDYCSPTGPNFLSGFCSSDPLTTRTPSDSIKKTCLEDDSPEF